MGLMDNLRYVINNELNMSFEHFEHIVPILEEYKLRVQKAKSQALTINNQAFLNEVDGLLQKIGEVNRKLGAYVPAGLSLPNDARIGFRTSIRSPEDYLILYAAIMTETMAKVSQQKQAGSPIKQMFSLAEDLYYADDILNRPSKKGMNLKETFEHNHLLQAVFKTK